MTRTWPIVLALLASACSNGPSPDQARLAELEQENAQLRADLEKAKGNVSRLHSIISHGGYEAGETGEAQAGATVPAGIVPEPQNNIGGTSAEEPGGASSGGAGGASAGLE